MLVAEEDRAGLGSGGGVPLFFMALLRHRPSHPFRTNTACVGYGEGLRKIWVGWACG